MQRIALPIHQVVQDINAARRGTECRHREPRTAKEMEVRRLSREDDPGQAE
jgi:hypothetical protein